MSCEVACSFLPSSVCSKNQYWKTDEHDGDRDDQEILAVEIDGAELDAGRVEPALQHLRLRAVEGEHRVARKIEAPIVAMITGRKLRLRNG